jgi:polyisoprenoid-binding protein YceI
METTATAAPQTPTTDLPDGAWRVVPEASELRFAARGMFGLATVNGEFTSFDGVIATEGTDARGELRIDAASLDTKHAKRDKHLRSSDFFHVEDHPTVTFSLAGLAPRPEGLLHMTGLLTIKQTALAIEAPVTATLLPDGRLRLATEVAVDRVAAGVGWSKMGMIKGKARLSVSVVLERDDF